MTAGLIVQKKLMTQAYNEAGVLVPLTVLAVPANFVVQVKSKEKDGYKAVQLGTGKKREVTKPVAGHLEKAKITEKIRLLREVPLLTEEKPKEGEALKVENVFAPGDIVDAIGKSKGRGFSGVVKRWGFATSHKTRGQSDRERAPGSIGAQTPGRVLKGKKMPGHFGYQSRTVKNLTVIKIDPDKQQIWVKGAVPGPANSMLVIRRTGKTSKKFVALQEEKQNGKEGK